jgi:hypothetical protein
MGAREEGRPAMMTYLPFFLFGIAVGTLIALACAVLWEYGIIRTERRRHEKSLKAFEVIDREVKK